MKKIYTFLALAIVACSAWAQDFNSPGDGSTWTLSQIAALDTVGITKSGTTVTMHSNVVINAGDKFVIEDGLNVLMASNVCINIQGTADFTAATNVSFKPIVSEDATPYGLLINATAATPFKNINFEGAGVRFQDQVGATFENCSFNYHNGVSSNMGAIALGMGATYGVKNCSFTECKYSAINGAANVNNPIVIDNCVFTKNVQANSNMPQVNLTVADLVTISNCVFEGDPSLNMVGGIGVSNLTSMAGTFGCIIENNEVRNHRYGITLTAARGGIIRNNTIVDNHYENDPMNGGSGISLTYAKDVTLSGNYIEGNYWGITVIGTKAYTAFMGDVYEAQNINAGRVDVDANDPNYNEGRNIFYKNGFTGSTTYDGDKFDYDGYNANRDYIQFEDPLRMFDGKDARLAAVTILPGSMWKDTKIVIQGGVILTSGEVKMDVNGDIKAEYIGADGQIHYQFGANEQKFFSGFSTNAGNNTRTGFGFRKYLDPAYESSGSVWNESTTDWMDIRFAEILLNYAEAWAESGLGDAGVARESLNRTRRRAGHTVDIEPTLENILRERRAELCLENARTWDLIRRREFHKIFDGQKRGSLTPVLDLRTNKYIFVREYVQQTNFQRFADKLYYRGIPGLSANGLVQNPQF